MTLLLPPILRSRLLISLLKVMINPLCYIYAKFYRLRTDTDNKLNITGNVQYLEKALNDAFSLTDRQIYIETPEENSHRLVFYFRQETHPAIFFHSAGKEHGHVLCNKGEYISSVNFIVKVPTFICTSVECMEDDKYGWKYYNIIRNLLNIYKPAGRMFGIELYDYE